MAQGASTTRATRIDALGTVALGTYVLIAAAFVLGFGSALRTAVPRQNETPCRSLAPLQARLTGVVVDEDGTPVANAELVPVFGGRTLSPVGVRPDGTFTVFAPKGWQQIQVRAPGKAALSADVRFEASQLVDVEVRLVDADGSTPGTLTEKSRAVWEAPDLALEDLQGNDVRLSSYRGKLVVLNFWATWCEPCITEWPQVAKLAHRLKEDGEGQIAVLAVSIDQERDEIDPFLQRMSLFDSPVEVLWDDTTKQHEDFGSEKIPDTYFVDEQGRVAAVFVNVREWGSPDALHCVESSVDD
ncbi:redoxin domain-containing protein [Paraliomyxa miuraensis]|uniref:redoxin domain-containing protein n=1 Tax=Paraliomyxa miuraensis TaxID=376150 RepID=UPI0022549453|nr:redoxin domain-containing protein [Paraliomyxa miuraensis]MCX4239870.1 redoxin domain-containing protein [Paraliomyxa miuraensis]